MKNFIELLIIAGMIIFVSCGSHREEKSEKIKQDSIAEIEKIKQDSIAKIEKIKKDSIAVIAAYKSYYDKNSKVAIKYPSGWEFTNKDLSDGGIFAISVPLKDASYDFRESVNLVISNEDALSQMTKKEYMDLSLSNLKIYIGNMVLNESKDITLNGYNAWVCVYTCKYNGKMVKMKQINIFKNSKVYILTYSAKKSTYDKFISTVNKIFETIKID